MRAQTCHHGQRVTRGRTRLGIELLEDRRLLAIFSGVPDWVDQGPHRIVTAYGDQIGAVEAIAVHPTIPNIVYAGSVNGGIWKTQTAGYSPFDGDDDNGDFATDDAGERPTWTPLTDGYANLSVGDIKFDPLDPTHETLYAAIGRFSSANQGSPAGKLLRTTNGGETWSEVAPLAFAGQHFRSVLPTARLEPTGQVLMATAHEINISSGEGLYRSADGGTSWQLISGALATSDGLDNDGDGLTDEMLEWNLPPEDATIVIADPADSSRYFVGVPEYGVFRSTDGGALAAGETGDGSIRRRAAAAVAAIRGWNAGPLGGDGRRDLRSGDGPGTRRQ